MNITLKDIAESEKICEAADILQAPWLIDGEYISIKVNEPDWEVDYSGLEPILTARDGYSGKETVLAFASHASTQLPAMNKLVREMLHALKFYANMENYRCIISGGISGSEVANDFGDEARRLIERLEG